MLWRCCAITGHSVTYINGILLPKMFWPTLREYCSSDWEKLLKFEAEGREFIQTVKGQNNFWYQNTFLTCSWRLGGRHFVDIIGDISWTKGVTFRGHFWWHFVDKNVHEMSSFLVTFRGHVFGDISWTFFLVNSCGHLSSNKLTQNQPNPNLT